METCLSGLWKMPLMFFRLLWAKLYGIMENAPAADVLFGANFPFHFGSIILKRISQKNTDQIFFLKIAPSLAPWVQFEILS